MRKINNQMPKTNHQIPPFIRRLRRIKPNPTLLPLFLLKRPRNLPNRRPLQPLIQINPQTPILSNHLNRSRMPPRRNNRPQTPVRPPIFRNRTNVCLVVHKFDTGLNPFFGPVWVYNDEYEASLVVEFVPVGGDGDAGFPEGGERGGFVENWCVEALC